MTGHLPDTHFDDVHRSPVLPRAAQTQIGRRLRAEYDCSATADLPDEMARLLSELESRLSGS